MFIIILVFENGGNMLQIKEAMASRQRSYLPAAGHDLFLPLYDPFVKLLGGDKARKRLLGEATFQPGDHVLEIGCGTGTLLTMIKQTYPGVKVVGLDPDPKALARAKRKSIKVGFDIQFDQGFSDELPYPDAIFDRIFSSFMFHHLKEDEKKGTLMEVHRVLKPGGSFYLLDFSGPNQQDGLFARWIHSGHRLKDNAEEKIRALIQEAGFQNPRAVTHKTMFLGRMVYYRTSKTSN
jgi:ubiquinone/menaquinone biosynthesis C-methylase UbiE